LYGGEMENIRIIVKESADNINGILDTKDKLEKQLENEQKKVAISKEVIENMKM
jgi:hypothetical protein